MDDFVEKTDFILQHEEVQRNFSRYSLRMVEKHFTARKMANSYLRLYNTVAAKA